MLQGLQHSCHVQLYNLDYGTHKNFSRKSKVKVNFKLKSQDKEAEFKSQGKISALTMVAGGSIYERPWSDTTLMIDHKATQMSYATRIIFFADNYTFCSNYPDILCIIASYG